MKEKIMIKSLYVAYAVFFSFVYLAILALNFISK